METITQHLCYNCFRELPGGAEACPYCGFDPAENARKYPMALPAGTSLNGRYVVGRVLGQGGFGITYLAFDTQLQAKVAIKEFLPSEIATRTDQTTVSVMMADKADEFAYGSERFQEEARTLAKFIGNPNIAGVSSYFDENDTSYFVMDYIEGVSFKNYIAQQGGTVTVDDALNVMIPVLRALTAVHAEGFIHRDVTPDNIYISKDGNVKLLDFGSARYSIGDKSKSLDVVLKVGYAPKEQYIRRGRQGPYTDVYSCAACLYAAITGYLPPESLERLDEDTLQPVSALGIDIPAYLDAAILKGLAVQPEDRFQSAAEFLDAIETQTVVEIPAAPGAQPAAPAKKKVKPALVAGIAAAALAVAVGVGTLVGGGSGGSPTGGAQTEQGGEKQDGRPLIKAEVPSITINGEEYSTDLRKLDLKNMGLTDEDIQDLKYMVNLNALWLDGNDITDVTPLAGLTQLEYINLMENPNLTDLSPLAGLTNMTEFNYYGSPVEDLSFMAGWTKLEYVQLNDIGEQDLSFLSGMTNVRNLDIDGTDNVIKDLSFLSGMTGLKEVYIQGDLQITDLSPLAGLTNLTELCINSNGGSTGGVKAKDLTALSGMTKLQKLTLDIESLESFQGLEGLTELTELYIYGNGNGGCTAKDLSFLSGMTKLKNLQISVDGLESLHGLEEATGLRELSIYSYSSTSETLQDISALANMSALTKLNLRLSANAKDLSPLAGLTALQELNLGGEFYFTELPWLSGMAELKDLRIYGDYNSTLKDYTDLKNLTKLQKLQLNAGHLESLAGLENLTELQEVNLSGNDSTYTDTAPLKNLTKVKTLDLPDRHYDDRNPCDLSGIGGMTSLQELRFTGWVTSLEGLSGLTNLKTLHFSDQSDYQDSSKLDLTPLANLTSLTKLQIRSDRVYDWTPVGAPTELVELQLSGREGNDLTPLSTLTNLRSLQLSVGNYQKKVKDLSPLGSLTNLTELTVYNCKDNIDTSPVDHVTNLTIS